MLVRRIQIPFWGQIVFALSEWMCADFKNFAFSTKKERFWSAVAEDCCCNQENSQEKIFNSWVDSVNFS